MVFTLLIITAFIGGILVCMPLAQSISPPSTQLLVVLFAPLLILYMFSQNPIVSTIRYMYLSFIIGMCCYWTYFETIKKIKGS